MYNMLYASFREPTGIFSGWFNRFAATATHGNFCHSEFIFKWTQKELKDILTLMPNSSLAHTSGTIHVAFYIMWGTRVQYRILSDDAIDDFWRLPTSNLIPITMEFKNEKKMFEWCMKQYGKEYDKFGALGCWVPVRTQELDYPTYFCSQLMACALNHMYVTSINPASTTPNSLYATLTAR